MSSKSGHASAWDEFNSMQSSVISKYGKLNRNTKLDNFLFSTMQLREIADRVKNTKQFLSNLHEVFTSMDLSKRQKTSMLVSLKTTVIPFLELAASNINKSATRLSPITCSRYAHTIQESNKKRKLSVVSTDLISTPLMLLQHTMNSSEITPLPRKQLFRSSKQKKLPSVIESLPSPRNSPYYGKDKVCQVVNNYPDKLQSRVVKVILEKQLITGNRTVLYDLLNTFKTHRNTIL